MDQNRSHAHNLSSSYTHETQTQADMPLKQIHMLGVPLL